MEVAVKQMLVELVLKNISDDHTMMEIWSEKQVGLREKNPQNLTVYAWAGI